MARSSPLLTAIGRGIRAAHRDSQRRAAAANRDRQRHAAAVLREQQRHEQMQTRALQIAGKMSDAAQAREEKARFLALREAEADDRSADAQAVLDEIDSLLAASLETDDYVDLNTLRFSPQHPPFDSSGLNVPTLLPEAKPHPLAPVLRLPDAPGALGSLFGGKKKHAEAVQAAQIDHARAQQTWQNRCAQLDAEHRAALEKHATLEAERIRRLAEARERYEAECGARVEEAESRNRAIDELIANLAYGSVDAVQEYVSIVMSNSAYPESFPVEHDFEFDPETAELRLLVKVPKPDSFPTTKGFKYVKASNEIAPVAMTQKELRERYTSAVHQVALRTLHEVFEADRRGTIQTIALEVGARALDPATGTVGWTPFVIAGAERDAFLALELASVVPHATLTHLGAALSKNPFKLERAQRQGVRRA